MNLLSGVNAYFEFEDRRFKNLKIATLLGTRAYISQLRNGSTDAIDGNEKRRCATKWIQAVYCRKGGNTQACLKESEWI